MLSEYKLSSKAINDMEISKDNKILTVACDTSVHFFEIPSLSLIKSLSLSIPCDAISLHPDKVFILYIYIYLYNY